jgi:hypothetical protein
MPYPNYHAARMTSPKKNYIRIRNKKIADGIIEKVGVLPKAEEGKRGGRTEVQSYWFDKSKFTVAQAKKWLKDHDLKPILFEPARETNQKPKKEAISSTRFREILETKLANAGR